MRDRCSSIAASRAKPLDGQHEQKVLGDVWSFSAQTGAFDFESTSKEEHRAQFLVILEGIRATLRRMNRRTIAPNSTFLQYWDAAIVFALLFTAIVTPFEVAFMTLYIGRINYTLNRVVDAIFLLDMVFTFFIPYRAAARDGEWTYDNHKIARNY